MNSIDHRRRHVSCIHAILGGFTLNRAAKSSMHRCQVVVFVFIAARYFLRTERERQLNIAIASPFFCTKVAPLDVPLTFVYLLNGDLSSNYLLIVKTDLGFFQQDPYIWHVFNKKWDVMGSLLIRFWHLGFSRWPCVNTASLLTMDGQQWTVAGSLWALGERWYLRR